MARRMFSKTVLAEKLVNSSGAGGPAGAKVFAGAVKTGFCAGRPAAKLVAMAALAAGLAVARAIATAASCAILSDPATGIFTAPGCHQKKKNRASGRMNMAATSSLFLI